MEIILIFLKKDENESTRRSEIIKLLQAVTKSIDDNVIKYSFEGSIYELPFMISSDNYKRRVLKVECNASELKAARILDSFKNQLIAGVHRKNFYINVSYDESALTFCNKAYKLLGAFERKLRELIYLILLTTMGTQWVDKTVPEDLQRTIKEVSHGNITLVESALDELTIYNLEAYLFESRYPDDFDEWFEYISREDVIGEIDETTLRQSILQMRKITLWERYFSEVEDITLVQNQLKQIRGYRNNVMHHKRFTYDDYLSLRCSINPLMKSIDKAITRFEDSAFNVVMAYYFSSAFSEQFKAVANELSKSMELLAKSLKPAIEMVVSAASGLKTFSDEIARFNSLVSGSSSNAFPMMLEDSSATKEPEEDDSQDNSNEEIEEEDNE